STQEISMEMKAVIKNSLQAALRDLQEKVERSVIAAMTDSTPEKAAATKTVKKKDGKKPRWSEENGDEEQEGVKDAREAESQCASQVGSQTGSRAGSPAISEIASTTTTVLEADVIKELMKLIPKYDGSGGIQKLIEYVEAFQRYSD